VNAERRTPTRLASLSKKHKTIKFHKGLSGSQCRSQPSIGSPARASNAHHVAVPTPCTQARPNATLWRLHARSRISNSKALCPPPRTPGEGDGHGERRNRDGPREPRQVIDLELFDREIDSRCSAVYTCWGCDASRTQTCAIHFSP
jgi:hypothetical protein